MKMICLECLNSNHQGIQIFYCEVLVRFSSLCLSVNKCVGYDNISSNLLISRRLVMDTIKILKDLGYINIQVYRSFPKNNKCNIYKCLK